MRIVYWYDKVRGRMIDEAAGTDAGESEVCMNKKQSVIRSYEDAVKIGYKVQSSKHPTKQVQELCRKLGAGYHLARVNGWNAAHRVIGAGWSVAVYPTSRGRDCYVVELLHDYGRAQVARIHGLAWDEVERAIDLLERKYIGGEDALDI